MPKVIGKFTFILHSHLPYVISHGRWPHGLDWLNEASAETYIPLLDVLYKLVEEGYSPKTTIGLTPVLVEMLRHPDFKDEFISYLDTKIKAAQKDSKEFIHYGDKHFTRLALMWKDYYLRIKKQFTHTYDYDLVDAFKKLQDEGHIEIITCAATHGYLPLLSQDLSIQAQIKMGIESYKKHFDRQPLGIWLPECAYRPRYEWKSPIEGWEKIQYLRKGIEEFLSENEIKYFIIDSHLLRGGKAIGVYLDKFEALRTLWKQFSDQYKPSPEDPHRSPYLPYYVKSYPEEKEPVAVFTRDPKTGLQVWSGEWGYPGNGFYLDFHKKKFPGGHRYWKVTSAKADLADKLPYYPENAEQLIPEQASHFASLIYDILKEQYEKTGKIGIVTSPYDTELFGHWWFEGPNWIYYVLKNISNNPEIQLTTCGEYLNEYKPTEVISIPEGSWGEGGYHYIWLNDINKWTWKHVYEAEELMVQGAKKYSDNKDCDIQRLLRLLGRELLLLQSSDWQFLISTFSAKDYAELRLANHYETFKRVNELLSQLGEGKKISKEEWLFIEDIEKRDRVFEEIKPEWWAKLDVEPIK